MIQISGSFISTSKKYSGFSLSLDQEVTIVEAYIPEFSLSSFFASLGGSLGLWLGVGVVQILSSGVKIITWFRVKINKFYT